MNNKTVFVFVFFVLLFSACLRNGTNTYKVENSSQYDFFFSSVIEGDTSTFKSEPETTYTFYSETGLGVEVPDAEDFLILFDEVYIVVNDSMNCLKDLNHYDSWIHQYSGKSASHTLQIDSIDIQ